MEIYQLNVRASFAHKQNVFRLQVHVDYIALMKVSHTANNVFNDLSCFGFGKEFFRFDVLLHVLV